MTVKIRAIVIVILEVIVIVIIIVIVVNHSFINVDICTNYSESDDDRKHQQMHANIRNDL